MNNRNRLTLASFLAYFVMSGMLAPMGIISGPMAEHFSLPVTEITARFSWLSFGILVGSVVALVVFDWLKLRTLMMLVYATIAASLLTLMLPGNLSTVGLALGMVGVCCGIGLAGAALTISRCYDIEKRASMLVITDGSFSAAGVVCSWLTIYLIAGGYHWAAAWQFVALVALVIVALSATASFPENAAAGAVAAEKERWPAPVWLCIVGLFLYTLGQWALLLWLPTYAETIPGTSREQGGSLVSQFWTGMFAAQIFVAWWVLKVGVRRLVVLAVVTTALFSIPLWLVTDVDALFFLATLWGFANLGLLKVVLSFATEMLERPTPRLVSSLLLGATLGTAVAPAITSWIVAATDSHFVLQFGTACYVALACLLIAADRLHTPKPAAGQVRA